MSSWRKWARVFDTLDVSCIRPRSPDVRPLDINTNSNASSVETLEKPSIFGSLKLWRSKILTCNFSHNSNEGKKTACRFSPWDMTSPEALDSSELDLLEPIFPCSENMNSKYNRDVWTVPQSMTIHRGKAPKSGIHFVEVVNNNYNDDNDNVGHDCIDGTVILAHGFASGLALYAGQIGTLSRHFRRVVAFDWPGFGLSDRPAFEGSGSRDAEDFFLEPMNTFFSELGIDNEPHVLCGHSMGGYLSAVHAIDKKNRHGDGDNLRGVILLSPFGLPEVPEGYDPKKRVPKWLAPVVAKVENGEMSAQTILRSLGPIGPRIVKAVRGQLAAGLSPLFHGDVPEDENNKNNKKEILAAREKSKEIVGNYVYHINAQPGSWESGEKAFSNLTRALSYARDPVGSRLAEMDPRLPLHFFYGDRDWMDPRHAVAAIGDMPDAEPNVKEIGIVPRAGHNLMMDNFADTSQAIIASAKTMFKN